MSRVLTWARKLRVGGPGRKVVLLVLADHADANDWSTFVGQETIAEEAEMSVRTVQRTMADLEEMGVLTRERRYRRGGFRTSDRTFLNRFWQPPDDDPSDVNLSSETTANGDHPDPQGDKSSPDNDDGLRRHCCRLIEEPPEEPPALLTFVDQLTSRAVSRRPDQRRRQSRPPRAKPAPPAPLPDPRVLQTCQLLAASDLEDRRTAWLTSDLDPVHHEWAWHAEATAQHLDRDGPQLAALAAQHPRATARQLAALHEPPALAPPELSPWTTPVATPAPVIDLRPNLALLSAQAAASQALRRALQDTG